MLRQPLTGAVCPLSGDKGRLASDAPLDGRTIEHPPSDDVLPAAGAESRRKHQMADEQRENDKPEGTGPASGAAPEATRDVEGVGTGSPKHVAPGKARERELAEGAPAAPAPAKASDLKARVVTAIVAVPIIVALSWIGGLWFMLLIVGVVGAASYEFYTFMEAKNYAPAKRVGTIASIALVVLAQGSNEYFITLLLTATILVVMMYRIARGSVATAISGTSVTFFGIIYVGWLNAHFVLLRNIGYEVTAKYMVPWGQAAPDEFIEIGFFYLILALVCTFLADTGGYFMGRKFGRRKLAPTISPKKTWEGLGGSFLGAIGGGLVAKVIFQFIIYHGESYAGDFGYGHVVILAILITAFGLIGDLAESQIKRDAQVKDSSGLLPGHGGLLDRLDSLCFSIPITYYYVKIYYYFRLSPDVSGDFFRFLERFSLS